MVVNINWNYYHEGRFSNLATIESWMDSEVWGPFV